MPRHPSQAANRGERGIASTCPTLRQVGLEDWLRSKGIRPGPVYTLLQFGAMVIALVLVGVVIAVVR